MQESQEKQLPFHKHKAILVSTEIIFCCDTRVFETLVPCRIMHVKLCVVLSEWYLLSSVLPSWKCNLYTYVFRLARGKLPATTRHVAAVRLPPSVFPAARSEHIKQVACDAEKMEKHTECSAASEGNSRVSAFDDARLQRAISSRRADTLFAALMDVGSSLLIKSIASGRF